MQNTKKYQNQSNRVLVVGGGLGGIRTALDLAQADKEVVLIESNHTIGGLMTHLDRTFPTNNCDLCSIAPCLSDTKNQENIELLPLTSVENVEGAESDFRITLKTEPRYINLEKCNACGACHDAFPECVKVSAGLDYRAPTCMRYPKDTPQSFAIDLTACEDIEALVKTCPMGAINPDDIPRMRTIKCASVVLAPGADVFDPSKLDYLGYKELPDVVTSLEYEKILSASGPTSGNLLRPSDGKAPKKVAWIQCVGSRGVQKGAGSHCSHACCMFALKEAIITKERFDENIETTIFYMDMRTFGKGYENYFNRAKDEVGIRFLKSRPHSVIQPEGKTTLEISYTTEDSTQQQVEDFDMVVLSTGFKTSSESKVLAQKMGIELSDDFFAVTKEFDAVATSRPGVYVAGTFEAPKDIPETIVQASAAACLAASHTQPSVKESSVETAQNRDFSDEEPRVGVFICDDDNSIAEVVDIDAVLQSTQNLPFVTIAQLSGNSCSYASLAAMKELVAEHKLNRVVVAGYSPRTHWKRFQKFMEEAGLNKYLLEMANIREQVSRVHGDQPEQATQKTKVLIKMAVSAVVVAQPLADTIVPMNQNALVVGGGVAGMTSALRLADQEYKVYLAEKSAALGGLSKHIYKTLEGSDVQPFVAGLVDKVTNHDNIELIPQAEIVDQVGSLGMFTTGINVGANKEYRQIEHGVSIFATGAQANNPKAYLLGNSRTVRTQFATQKYIAENPEEVKKWGTVAMIQCVGSRDLENPNCSRVCCQTAVKNALAILEINPGAQIFVLYRDIRTYGAQESYYQMAREKGVIFVRYEPDNPPVARIVGDQVEVSYDDKILGMNVTLVADSLSLSAGMKANAEGNKSLAKIFKLALTDDSYLKEEHVKLAPLDMATPGIFVAGTAHSPKLITEAIVQANGAASRAMTMLAQKTVTIGAATAKVDGDLCATCLICVRACPYGIPVINAERYSEIDAAKCHGCGSCVAACPAKAIQLEQFEDDRIFAKIDQLFERISA